MSYTYQSFRTPVNVRELDAGIANSGRVDDRGDLWHVLQAQLVEKRRIVMFEARKVDVFLNGLVFGTELGQGTLIVDGAVVRRWQEPSG